VVAELTAKFGALTTNNTIYDTTIFARRIEVPKSSGGGYMKFKQGANKFRILSAPVMG